MIKKFLITTIFLIANNCYALPTDFVYLKDIDSSIIQDIKYAGADNFIGKSVQGYHTATCILTREAAEALAKIQRAIAKKSLSLKIYDCYRPQVAVDTFVTWSKDINDQKQKTSYYPNVNKADFFKLGYVAAKSGHTRGSTVDLTLVRIKPHHPAVELEMGTHFDFMDPTSHSLNTTIKVKARENRLLLRTLMINAGFMPLAEEWWHFTLRNEPFPHTYFNFPVE